MRLARGDARAVHAVCAQGFARGDRFDRMTAEEAVRLERHGKTWKVYVMEPMVLSFTGMIHFARLKDRLATHFVPFAEFEKDAAGGTLPDFSLIEPNMAGGHGDYHPAFGRSFSDTVDLAMDNPSSMLAGEAFFKFRDVTGGPTSFGLIDLGEIENVVNDGQQSFC